RPLHLRRNLPPTWPTHPPAPAISSPLWLPPPPSATPCHCARPPGRGTDRANCPGRLSGQWPTTEPKVWCHPPPTSTRPSHTEPPPPPPGPATRRSAAPAPPPRRPPHPGHAGGTPSRRPAGPRPC